MAQYEYLALSNPKNTIRVLKLEPSRQSKVCFTLIERSVENGADYDALSYSWESYNGTAEVWCDGERLEVTKNCCAALKRLRPDPKATRARLLWVDAICINQNDIDEKVEQIRLMDVVYTRARRVLVWLGEGFDNGSILVRSLKAYAGHYSHFDPPKKDNGDDDILPALNITTEYMERVQAALLEKSDSAQRKACYALLNRSWFRRVWIIQEVVLGMNIEMVCGSQSITFRDFFRSIVNRSFMEEARSDLLEPIQVINTLRVIHHKQIPQLPSMCLRLAGQFLATDPKDKVFGLCGLSKSLSHVLSKVDYKNDVSETYKEAVARCFGVEESLTVLILASGEPKEDLPSWVPDFSRQTPTFWDLYTRRQQSSKTRIKQKAKISGDLLYTVGRNVDTIHECLEFIDLPINEVSTMEHSFEAWKRWATIAATSNLAKTKDWEFRFIELLGWEILGPERLADSSTENEIGHWFKQNLFSDGPSLGTEKKLDNIILGPYKFASMVKASQGRKFSATQHGNCGIVPYQTRPGDSIVVFEGGSVPFIVRQDGDKFRLVGACHLALPYTFANESPASLASVQEHERSEKLGSSYGLVSLSGNKDGRIVPKNSQLSDILLV